MCKEFDAEKMLDTLLDAKKFSGDALEMINSIKAELNRDDSPIIRIKKKRVNIIANIAKLIVDSIDDEIERIERME